MGEGQIKGRRVGTQLLMREARFEDDLGFVVWVVYFIITFMVGILIICKRNTLVYLYSFVLRKCLIC